MNASLTAHRCPRSRGGTRDLRDHRARGRSGARLGIVHALGEPAPVDPGEHRRPRIQIIAVIIIIVTGLTLAFGETSGGFRRLIQIVFGLSIAFAASSFFLSFFSFGGGALV